MAESEKPQGGVDTVHAGELLAVSKTGALAPLLLLTGIMLFAVLGFIENQPAFQPNEGVMAAVPHSPSEFPAIFGKDLSIDGLDGGTIDGGVAVAGPPFSRGIFPCMDCHGEKDLPPNPQRRELVDKHKNIKLVNHDEEHRWCLDCHDLNDRDSLHLAGGELVPFTESYRLCGQCHGPQYRDWKVGIHGKRTGYWNGPKRYMLCVNCHNPHSPHFAPLQPLPPPVRPHFLRASDRPPPGPAEVTEADGGAAAPAEPKKEESHGK